MTEAPSLSKIKTRLLILSDTHGLPPKHKFDDDPSTDDELGQDDLTYINTGYREPLAEADVVIHCGDLTKRSLIPEYQNTFAMLRAIRAPLKLVIAGNHDRKLDAQFCKEMYGEAHLWADDAREAWNIIEAAREDGVHFLNEGVHDFDLENGAHIKVYASPYTPAYGGWAFQYRRGHDFQIPPDADVAMTHGPPRGVLDMPRYGSNAGCPDLFEAVHRARPKIHCFGHIHEAWGCLLARWKEGDDVPARVETVVDMAQSRRTGLAGLRPDKTEHDEDKLKVKRERLAEIIKARGVQVDLSKDGENIEEGQQTLFVNAAVMNVHYRPLQPPWLIDVDLPRIQEIGS
ncbi:hypothetical protein G7046_g8561 [Stylonectria norvegica]|nr:hypothetical protein G7046_g8561 [Stylonectria norvegica]